MVAVCRVKVGRVVVRGGGRASVCEEVELTVVGFGVLYYWKTGPGGVGVEASVVSMYYQLRV